MKLDIPMTVFQLYLSQIIVYNAMVTYQDGVAALTEFRQGKLNKSGVSSDLDAVKHGISNKFGQRFSDSVLLPFTIVRDTFPVLVLWLNPK